MTVKDEDGITNLNELEPAMVFGFTPLFPTNLPFKPHRVNNYFEKNRKKGDLNIPFKEYLKFLETLFDFTDTQKVELKRVEQVMYIRVNLQCDSSQILLYAELSSKKYICRKFGWPSILCFCSTTFPSNTGHRSSYTGNARSSTVHRYKQSCNK